MDLELNDETRIGSAGVCARFDDMSRVNSPLLAESADNTRLMRKPDTYTGVDRALQIFAKAYRRDRWAAARVYVEISCEKNMQPEYY